MSAPIGRDTAAPHRQDLSSDQRDDPDPAAARECGYSRRNRESSLVRCARSGKRPAASPASRRRARAWPRALCLQLRQDRAGQRCRALARQTRRACAVIDALCARVVCSAARLKPSPTERPGVSGHAALWARPDAALRRLPARRSHDRSGPPPAPAHGSGSRPIAWSGRSWSTAVHQIRTAGRRACFVRIRNPGAIVADCSW